MNSLSDFGNVKQSKWFTKVSTLVGVPILSTMNTADKAERYINTLADHIEGSVPGYRCIGSTVRNCDADMDFVKE